MKKNKPKDIVEYLESLSPKRKEITELLMQGRTVQQLSARKSSQEKSHITMAQKALEAFQENVTTSGSNFNGKLKVHAPVSKITFSNNVDLKKVKQLVAALNEELSK